jgi:hypothetical protein
MGPRLLLILLFLGLVGNTGCQTYTTGLEKSVERADETSAIGALRAISLSEQTYSVSNGGEYGTLQQLTDSGLLDGRFGGQRPVKDYVLTLNTTTKPSEPSFSCNADPDPTTGRAGRHFYIDSTSGVIHVNDTQPATASDKALQ